MINSMNKNSEPIVSICLPVFNAEKTIAETIESVLSQTFEKWELLICDNNSSDKSWEIIGQYNDRRISRFKNDVNIGATGNFLKLLQIAKGEYIKFLCSDDIIYPECLEKQVNILSDDKSISIVTCNINIINESGEKIFFRKIPFKKKRVSLEEVLNYCLLTTRGSIMEPVQILTRRKDYARVMMPVRNEFSSAAYLLELLLEGELLVIDETLGAWRLVKHSLSTQQSQLISLWKLSNDLYKNKKFNISIWKLIASFIIAIPVTVFRRIAHYYYTR